MSMGKGGKRRRLSVEITVLTMLTSVCAMLLIGIGLTGIFFFYFSGQARADMKFVLEATNQQFQDRIEMIEDGMIALRRSTALRDFFKKNHYDREEMETQLIYSMDLFSDRNLTDGGNPFSVSVYVQNRKGDMLREHYYPLTVSEQNRIDESAGKLLEEFGQSGRQYFVYPQEQFLDLCLRIYDEEMREMGMCMVRISRRAVWELFEGIKAYENSGWMIGGNNGEVLHTNLSSQAAEALAGTAGGGTEAIRLNGKRTLCDVRDGGFGISSVIAVGIGNLSRILKPILFVFLAVFAAALFLITGAVFGISYRFTRPLKEVAEGIRAFGKQDLDVRMGDFSVEEFHEISIVFNEMADRLHYLITQVYEKELLATQNQVRYLQSQINPHFQYNILAMLSLKAKLAGNEELYQCLRAFSKLLQGKIFREKEIKIPLADELELVDFYLYLQNSRFQEKITYEIKCSGPVKECLIPKLLIEPLVENAVSHGLEPKNSAGHILVEAFEREGKLFLSVEDDGVGFDVESLSREMGKTEENAAHTHVGILNTERLLHILYGETCRMEIHGGIGKGTRVEIILPAERREDVEGSGGR